MYETTESPGNDCIAAWLSGTSPVNDIITSEICKLFKTLDLIRYCNSCNCPSTMFFYFFFHYRCKIICKVKKLIKTRVFIILQIARSERHKCDVAIKIVSKFQEATDYLEKFLPREIEVVKGLKHENLIKYYQAIETTHRWLNEFLYNNNKWV